MDRPPVKASNVLAWGDSYVIFEGNYINAPGHSYGISPDGKRFLVVKEVHEQGDSLELSIITNWPSNSLNRERAEEDCDLLPRSV